MMGTETKPQAGDVEVAKHGIMFQFETMFDETTRNAMLDMGMQRFLDHMIDLRAHDLATIRVYSHHLGPAAQSKSNQVYNTQFMKD